MESGGDGHFGSAQREDFGPHSDTDVLVSFEGGARLSLFDLVRMEQELEALLRRPVNLVPRLAVMQTDNYIQRKGILENAEVIYAAG